jgi:hypothetical protein
MKILKKFWGVALVIILLSTLFLSAAPVSAADVLRWENKTDTPVSTYNVLAPDSTIVGYAVNGAVMYAVGGTIPDTDSMALYQTTNSGVRWTDISSRLDADVVGTADYVAIAPDNTNIVVVATDTPDAGTGLCIEISVNGGLTFTSMGIVYNADTDEMIETVDGIAISPAVSGGYRYVVVYGVSDAGNSAIYRYNYGSGVGSWKDAVTDFTGSTRNVPDTAGNEAVTFAFSPIFASDYMAEVVLYDSATRAFDLHELSFNANGNWDTEPGYPANIYTATGAVVITKFSITLNPSYDGSDESSRIAFIGADFTDAAAQVGGVFRANDASITQIYGASTGQQIWSVSFDGTNLAAGSSVTNNVLRSVNPLASSPTFSSARNLKRIGTLDGADHVIVLYADGTLYGAKAGTGSAMSKSTDYGNSWDDFALINDAYETAGTIDDIYVTDTGDPWFMSTNDGITSNVYRISGSSVSRVLCVPTGVNFILRGISSSTTLIYAADTYVAANAPDNPGADIYYSADGGLTRWFKRTSPVALADLVVDSSSTIFIGAAETPEVYKSTNMGFTWSDAQTTDLNDGVFSMYALGSGNVIASSEGYVSYTTDGGDSWNLTDDTTSAALGFSLVTANGLADGSYIFAAPIGSDAVYRCLIGSTNTNLEWENMNVPANSAAGLINTAILYKSGVLYTLLDATTGSYFNRNSFPSWGTPKVKDFWSAAYYDSEKQNSTVGALQGIVANDIFTIYTIDTTAAPGNTVRYFQDSLVFAHPVLNGPADGALIQLTSATMGTSQNVNFTWNRISKATGYFLFIYLDKALTQYSTMASVASTSSIVAKTMLGEEFNPGNTYYWFVMASTPIYSGISEVRSFTIVANAASVPELASPAIGTTVQPDQVAFSWSPTAGTTSYSFQLDTGATFTAPLYSTTVTSAGASLPLTVTLERGRMYYWRVKALTPTEGDWSSVGNFIVAAEATSLTTTTVASTTVTSTVITIPQATSTIITMPAATQTVEEVNPTYIWAIIIIGAVLVLAVIVLIVRTRRSV